MNKIPNFKEIVLVIWNWSLGMIWDLEIGI